MDDGYANHIAEYDRAELAEQRLEIATSALRAIGQRHQAAQPATRLALKQIREHTQKVR